MRRRDLLSFYGASSQPGGGTHSASLQVTRAASLCHPLTISLRRYLSKWHCETTGEVFTGDLGSVQGSSRVSGPLKPRRPSEGPVRFVSLDPK